MPMEDSTHEEKEQNLTWHLQVSLYGTRDAAANFQAKVKKLMRSIGFTVGRYKPVTFFHKDRGINKNGPWR